MQNIKMIEDRIFPMGTLCEADGVHVAAHLCPEKECGIALFDMKNDKVIRVPFPCKTGNIYYGKLIGVKTEQYSYCFYEDENLLSDPYMRSLAGKTEWGKIEPEYKKAAFYKSSFSWGQDKNPCISWKEAIVYQLHVRGFTIDNSSKVKNKGTFKGIMEKLPYLQKLGVTTLELLPAYEFAERAKPKQEEKQSVFYKQPEEPVLNYWGFKDGFYYMPKASYSSTSDSCTEMKQLVKELHLRGMELVMQFFFPANYQTGDIKEILAWWKQEYHIDGFHIKGNHIQGEVLAKEPLFTDTKLIFEYCSLDSVYERNKLPSYKNLALCEDGFLRDMRRFLKGDDNLVRQAQNRFYENSPYYGVLHSFADYNTFTMWDMVSYNRKHNEENGEENRDGSDYNDSWNCGEEGITKKRSVLKLRMQQLKNAMMLLFLSQGTPMLVAGDEFGRTQQGNNNPYCLDNEITWINWKNEVRMKELWQFTKDLISFRKEHPIFRLEGTFKLMDSLSCGYPDLSFHSEEAWMNPMFSNTHYFGAMLCGKYVKKQNGEEDSLFYLAVNMHWEEHSFALPNLPSDMDWICINTTEKIEDIGKCIIEQASAIVPPRCIQLFEATIVHSDSEIQHKSKRMP